MRTRTQLTMIIAGAALAVAAGACKDPSAGKPKATVSDPTPETAKVTGETPKAAAGETLAFTEANGTVGFTGAKITASHDGNWTRFSGSINLADGKPETSQVTIDIDLTTTIIPDNDRLTGHLKSPDFFDVATFPKATFSSTQIVAGGENGATHTITGNLDLHGVKKSITFPVTLTVEPAAVKAKSEFAINRKDFGIVYPGAPDDLIRDNVVLRFDLTVPRAAK
jgi:polyisoprenoid-binding protein YceI